MTPDFLLKALTTATAIVALVGQGAAREEGPDSPPAQSKDAAREPSGDSGPGYTSEEVTFTAGAIVAKAYLALPAKETAGPYPGIWSVQNGGGITTTSA